MKDLLKLYPELQQVTLDGATDFDQVAGVLGTRNPKIIWGVVNKLRESTESDPRLEALKNLLAL